MLVGDFNQDGQVDVFDAMGLYIAVIADANFSEEDMARLDVNQDGGIDVFDVMAIYAEVMGG